MTLPQEFWEQLPLKTDAELYDILAHPDDYLPEALAAVKAQLNERNLAPRQIAHLETRVISEQAISHAHAEEPLSWPLRIVVFLFCSGIPGILLAIYYGNKGLKRKASDCWIAIGASLAFHIVAGAIL